jgi:RND family efflux transporter MFP subunit
VSLAEAKLEEAKETLARCAITSPLAGRVDRMLVDEGEYVIAAQPVADVIQLDRLKLFVELSGRQLAALGDEVAAKVAADAAPKRVYTAALDHVAPRADPASRKFRLELHIENPDGNLLAGMFARCTLTGVRSREVMLVPAVAVVRRFGRDCCYVVVTDGEQPTCRLRPIETRTLGDRLDVIEVVSGLVTGDQVVIDSAADLRDGTAVAVSERTHAAALVASVEPRTEDPPQPESGDSQ